MKFLNGMKATSAILGLFALTIWTGAACASIKPAVEKQGPALKLNIQYYDKVLTSEGMLRESRYEETMVRRAGHVWSSRVLPPSAHEHVAHENEQEHKHFNPTILPRHIELQDGKLKVEFVDEENKQLINIAATEYQDVSFDGSWPNAFYLIDPKVVLSLTASQRKSNVLGATWYEQKKHGVFQRVLWDHKNMIPLEVETGTLNGAVYKRVSVTLKPLNDREAPWENLSGYASREYSDFLD